MPLVNKHYYIKGTSKALVIFFVILSISGIAVAILENRYLFIPLIALLFSIMAFVVLNQTETILHEKTIAYKIGNKKFNITFNSVSEIYDDAILWGHNYFIVGFDSISNKENTKIVINNFYQDYKSLLTNIITHTNPDAKVDKPILKDLSLTEQDIGKYFNDPEHWV